VGRVILDTGLLIEAERGQTDPASLVAVDDDVAIAAITVAELLHGVERAGERHRQVRRDWIERIVRHIPVKDYDVNTARVHARLLAESFRAGRARGSHDLIIAATAVATDRVVVTPDKGFAGLPGVQVRVVG
jgi:tRNA(fMet)-specific endonuclease VapC